MTVKAVKISLYQLVFQSLLGPAYQECAQRTERYFYVQEVPVLSLS